MKYQCKRCKRILNIKLPNCKNDDICSSSDVYIEIEEDNTDKRCKQCKLENNNGRCDRNDCSNYKCYPNEHEWDNAKTARLCKKCGELQRIVNIIN